MLLPVMRKLGKCGLALVAAIALACPTQAAFHLWDIQEVYTNASGTLQFIEFQTTFGSQQFVAGQQIQVSNIANSITNTLTLPTNLPGDSANRSFLVGTAGIQAAGSPAPDFIMPDGFLFQAGGTLNFFGTNSGPYSALPTDGSLSRTWNSGNAINSPTNFAGISGQIAVPEPTTVLLVVGALGTSYFAWRRKKNLQMTLLSKRI